MTSGRSELIELTLEKKRETAKAFQLSDGKHTEWAPKSLVEDNDDGTFTMPVWLATEKGWI